MADGANQPTATDAQPQIPDYGLLLLSVNDIMRIHRAEIRPDGPGLIEVTGKNGAGKTSLGNALAAALLGKDQLPKMPVRKGAKKGRCSVKLGVAGVPKLTIQYSWVAGQKDWNLELLDDKGRLIQRPREVLDTLMGSKLMCDPLALTLLERDKQQAILFQSVPGLADEIAKLNEREKNRASKASEVRAEKKAAEGSLAKLGDPPDLKLAKQEPASSADILARINKSRELQRHVQEATTARDGTLALIPRADEEITRIQAMLEEALAYRKTLDADLERQNKDVEINRAAAKDAEDIAALEAELGSIDKTNNDIQRAKTYIERENEVNDATARLDKFDEERDTIQEAKRNLLSKLNLPVEGLTYDEDQGLLYTGIPIAQASMAEKIKIGVAMGIAMQPHIRIFLIRELGSLLDADNKALLDKLCRDNGIYGLMECVGEGGIHIEDGYSPGLKPEDGAEGEEAPQDNDE